ncbi:glycosyltransferase family 2 protein [Desulfogranum japonicum]|uniref:glycosyltransferase family 2 protein n=1 Tax=Desulfogranum japonicum TaxID=231447 RepID=UPI000426545E|nr:glycosyltransferase family 2 protein [Desulfogranum japonicum]
MPESSLKEISVVIPAYNEENAVAQEIMNLKKVLDVCDITYEIIVVDDGSKDRTAEEAIGTGVQVLRHVRNRGYGASLKTGINAAQYDHIAITDADGTYPAEALPAMLKLGADYDMVVGARVGPNAQIPTIRKPAKWFLRILASYLAGRVIPDLNSGLRVMKKSVVKRFEYLLPSGFSFTTTITLSMLCNDYLVHYHPIDYFQRVGKSKIKPVDAYYFFLLILRTIVYFNPLKVFLPIGAIFFATGLGKFIYDLFLGNMSETAVLGLLAAFLFWGMGLLSDQIAKVGMSLHRE